MDNTDSEGSIWGDLVSKATNLGGALLGQQVDRLTGQAANPLAQAAQPTGVSAPVPQTPFYKQPWFIPVAVVGGLIVIGLAVFTRRK